MTSSARRSNVGLTRAASVDHRGGDRLVSAPQSIIDDRLAEVRADERKIRQIVRNLLSNAIKFTPEGGRIEVGAVPKDGFVEVSVSDTGVGIAPEDQEAVFEEFRQVGTAEKKAEGGSGSRARWAPARRSRSAFRCAVANELILVVEDNEQNRQC
jgi:signal transduction histidine kinase